MCLSVKAAVKRDSSQLPSKHELSSRSSLGSGVIVVVCQRFAVGFTTPVYRLLQVSESGPVRLCGTFSRTPHIRAKPHMERHT
jgi:hypothetical protein